MADSPHIGETRDAASAPMVLDAVDRQIIALLHENARLPSVDLARAVGISP